MTRSDNTYSQVVAWMKIILPMLALGLLSTLFLISRTIDPTQSAPFARIDLEQRAQDQGATKPSFSGVTQQGDEILFTADTIRPEYDEPETLLVENIMARMALFDGTVVNITSLHAQMNLNNLTAHLEGRVHIITSTGYVVATDRLDTRLDEIHAESRGPISAEGSIGSIKAGRMLLQNNNESKEPELVFTGGVELIYHPGTVKE